MFDFESPEQMLLEEAVARWSDPKRRDQFLTTLQEQGYRQPVCTPSMGIDGAAGTRGEIKGSFPVNGSYGAWEYLNWACKFFIDSNLFESEIHARESKIYEIN